MRRGYTPIAFVDRQGVELGDLDFKSRGQVLVFVAS